MLNRRPSFSLSLELDCLFQEMFIQKSVNGSFPKGEMIRVTLKTFAMLFGNKSYCGSNR